VKKTTAFMMVILLTAFVFIPASAVMAGGDKNRGEVGQGSTFENGCEDQPCFADAPKPGPSVILESNFSVAADLDETEIANLIFIREEEKLARDVYVVLYEKWGDPVFANIIESELRHMDAVGNLLQSFGIPDPITSGAIGDFTNEGIRSLFDLLTAWGMESEADALLVGCYIEEYDILDIWEAHEETDEARIQRVYQNLYEGSYNHLNAFAYNYYLLTGETYIPKLLSSAEYDLVMTFATQAKQTLTPKQQKGK
jgi:hypothetical protein